MSDYNSKGFSISRNNAIITLKLRGYTVNPPHIEQDMSPMDAIALAARLVKEVKEYDYDSRKGNGTGNVGGNLPVRVS